MSKKKIPARMNVAGKAAQGRPAQGAEKEAEYTGTEEWGDKADAEQSGGSTEKS